MNSRRLLRVAAIAIAVVGCPHAWASPLTFELKGGQRECFYTLTPDVDCDVSYYFAVQQSANNDFKIGYEVFGPDSATEAIIRREGERQGEWGFVAEPKGEYSFCFYDPGHSDKVVDLEITYKCAKQDARDLRRAARKRQKPLGEAPGHDAAEQLQGSLENSVDTIERQLYQLERSMQYYKTRNNRNHDTVQSTERRIAMFSLYGIVLILGMSAAQIAVLQWFFKESRKQKV
ncbi:Erp3p KNAG_0K01670 [Huiozyma naganishii CBS 8797]|uniref:GOLD domain-containing protein n=1 Tax=Huiozyma naganishii (strain ATCC MYA-139 / BCRC 22969 / CBS 8797 / KCTC 17520 / NBRC 10181 / NCYC 3082 / Yp74L-3) TaxID=1071383 RepID=J7RCE3_HUIN7|nr:hypothetical protein KNAG_0K01670 [Kazachstania naganishii CBS 8797]CCK72530.1 hypothetical protein KNAG_0K01670 [Kazachstania naganishii CBS 8797]